MPLSSDSTVDNYMTHFDYYTTDDTMSARENVCQTQNILTIISINCFRKTFTDHKAATAYVITVASESFLKEKAAKFFVFYCIYLV